jgi:hypothetical protein
MNPRFAIALLPFLAGCGFWSVALPPGRPVMEAHAGPVELRVLDAEPPLRPRRKLPVLAPPEVFAAYVSAHVRPDLLVGEHWIYFKLRDAEWYTERLQAPEPPADGRAPEGLLRPLGGFDWSRTTLPHRAGEPR